MVAIVAKPQKKHVSPRTINAMMVGMTRHAPDCLRRISESSAFVDRVSSSDEVEARMSFNGNLNDDLCGETDIQNALGSGNVRVMHKKIQS